MSVCSYICLSIHTSVCLFIHLSVCTYICLSVHTSVCMFIHLSVCSYICLSVHTSVCLFIHMSVCSYICLSVHTSVCSYICLSVHTSVCQHLNINLNIKTTVSSINFKLYTDVHIDKTFQIRLCLVTLTARQSIVVTLYIILSNHAMSCRLTTQ